MSEFAEERSRCVRRDQGPTPDGVADDYAAADGGYFAAGQTTASVDRIAGLEISAVLVGVWEDHGVVNVVVVNVVVVVKSKSVSKCKFCFKPVQCYGSRW